LSKQQIIDAVDGQLTRLGTDYIDILQFHWPDRSGESQKESRYTSSFVPANGALFDGRRAAADFDLFQQQVRNSEVEAESTSIHVQLSAIADLIAAGKVRSFGLSNETPYGVASFVKSAEFHSLPRPVCLQNPLNLLEGQNEFFMGLSEACAPTNGNLGILAYSPLAGKPAIKKVLHKHF
jgi:aryl-alcohol dehydrogenase-like predicted oxidoreductase